MTDKVIVTSKNSLHSKKLDFKLEENQKQVKYCPHIYRKQSGLHLLK